MSAFPRESSRFRRRAANTSDGAVIKSSLTTSASEPSSPKHDASANVPERTIMENDQRHVLEQKTDERYQTSNPVSIIKLQEKPPSNTVSTIVNAPSKKSQGLELLTAVEVIRKTVTGNPTQSTIVAIVTGLVATSILYGVEGFVQISVNDALAQTERATALRVEDQTFQHARILAQEEHRRARELLQQGHLNTLAQTAAQSVQVDISTSGAADSSVLGLTPDAKTK